MNHTAPALQPETDRMTGTEIGQYTTCFEIIGSLSRLELHSESEKPLDVLLAEARALSFDAIMALAVCVKLGFKQPVITKALAHVGENSSSITSFVRIFLTDENRHRFLTHYNLARRSTETMAF